MTKFLHDQCPACRSALRVDWQDDRFSVWCSHGPCASQAANEGADDVTITGALWRLEDLIEAEQTLEAIAEERL